MIYCNSTDRLLCTFTLRSANAPQPRPERGSALLLGKPAQSSASPAQLVMSPTSPHQWREEGLALPKTHP